MALGMEERDWDLAVELFQACLPRRGDKAQDDRLFLEALHFFTRHNLTWRELPERFGKWNSVWRRFDRLGKAGVFAAFFELLAGLKDRGRLAHMFDSTVVRAHVSAAGAKGGGKIRLSDARRVVFRQKSTSNPILRGSASLSS